MNFTKVKEKEIERFRNQSIGSWSKEEEEGERLTSNHNHPLIQKTPKKGAVNSPIFW